METKNPWQQVPLEAYEAHMSLEKVAQLQALNSIMRKQFNVDPQIKTAVVLGVAGGNGLEHCRENLYRIYGIDINNQYLQVCEQRFRSVLGQRLQLLRMDLCDAEAVLPCVDLIIANLLIEYVGIEIFCSKTVATRAKRISCVIQLTDSSHQSFVSDSPYQKQLQVIDPLHQDISETQFCSRMAQDGYGQTLRDVMKLPNGKSLIRLDYQKGFKITRE